MSIIIKDIIPGSGEKWSIPAAVDRIAWLRENFQDDEYEMWYGGLKSDDFYVKFLDNQNALAYKLKWVENGQS